MTCIVCERGIVSWRKFCSRDCYYRWRIGRDFGKGVPHERYRKPNWWHAEHIRVMAELQAQRPSAQRKANAA